MHLFLSQFGFSYQLISCPRRSCTASVRMTTLNCDVLLCAVSEDR